MRRAARHRGDGYALIEVMLGLMLIALLAALGLPGFARGTGPAALQVSAMGVSALLREDRNFAISSGRPITTLVEAGRVRSEATGSTVTVPAGSTIIRSGRIRFLPDGHTSGGTIVIASANARVTVDVSEDTGAIHVAVP